MPKQKENLNKNGSIGSASSLLSLPLSTTSSSAASSTTTSSSKRQFYMIERLGKIDDIEEENHVETTNNSSNTINTLTTNNSARSRKSGSKLKEKQILITTDNGSTYDNDEVENRVNGNKMNRAIQANLIKTNTSSSISSSNTSSCLVVPDGSSLNSSRRSSGEIITKKSNNKKWDLYTYPHFSPIYWIISIVAKSIIFVFFHLVMPKNKI